MRQDFRVSTPTLGYRVADHRMKSLERSKLRCRKSVEDLKQFYRIEEKQRTKEGESLTTLQKACSWGALRVMQAKLTKWREDDTKKVPSPLHHPPREPGTTQPSLTCRSRLSSSGAPIARGRSTSWPRLNGKRPPNGPRPSSCMFIPSTAQVRSGQVSARTTVASRPLYLVCLPAETGSTHDPLPRPDACRSKAGSTLSGSTTVPTAGQGYGSANRPKQAL